NDLPAVAERHATVVLARHGRQIRAMPGGEHRLLAEQLPLEGRDLSGEAAVAVDVDVLAVERGRSLCRRNPLHPPEARHVHPRLLDLARIEVAIHQAADAFEIERLEDRVLAGL